MLAVILLSCRVRNPVLPTPHSGEPAEINRFGQGDPRFRLAINLHGALSMTPQQFADASSALNRRQAIRMSVSKGAYTTIGADFISVAVGDNYAWAPRLMPSTGSTRSPSGIFNRPRTSRCW
jgi:hypothetical protein